MVNSRERPGYEIFEIVSKWRPWFIQVASRSVPLLCISLIIVLMLKTVVSSTTVSSLHAISTRTTVPVLDFSKVDVLFNAAARAMGGLGSKCESGLTPFLKRIMAATASNMNILPMNAIIQDAIFTTTFSGPSFKCGVAPTNVSTVIDRVVHAINSPFDKLTGGAITAALPIVFIAFTPQEEMLIDAGKNFAHYAQYNQQCLGNPTIINTTSLIQGYACFGILGAAGLSSSTLESQSIWLKANDNYLSCALRDTHYTVTFNATGNVQTVNQNYTFEYADGALSSPRYSGTAADNKLISYRAVGQAVLETLNGYTRQLANAGRNNPNMQRPLLNTKTRITETSLYVALNRDSSTSSAEVSLARGLSMGSLIEELSRNLTLSLLSAPQMHSTNGTTVPVYITTSRNMYACNWQSLIWGYGIAILVTACSAIIGLRDLFQNGISHSTSFSAILCSTRNSTHWTLQRRVKV